MSAPPPSLPASLPWLRLVLRSVLERLCGSAAAAAAGVGSRGGGGAAGCGGDGGFAGLSGGEQGTSPQQQVLLASLTALPDMLFLRCLLEQAAAAAAAAGSAAGARGAAAPGRGAGREGAKRGGAAAGGSSNGSSSTTGGDGSTINAGWVVEDAFGDIRTAAVDNLLLPALLLQPLHAAWPPDSGGAASAGAFGTPAQALLQPLANAALAALVRAGLLSPPLLSRLRGVVSGRYWRAQQQQQQQQQQHQQQHQHGDIDAELAWQLLLQWAAHTEASMAALDPAASTTAAAAAAAAAAGACDVGDVTMYGAGEGCVGMGAVVVEAAAGALLSPVSSAAFQSHAVPVLLLAVARRAWEGGLLGAGQQGWGGPGPLQGWLSVGRGAAGAAGGGGDGASWGGMSGVGDEELLRLLDNQLRGARERPLPQR